jgi:diguanylate cyclase (GGDEF)-like protein
VLDLDDLKKINDKLGHAGGDKVLIAFSSILSDVIEKPNLVGRLGGDEFVVFLKTTDSIALQSLIDSILDRVRACEVNVEGIHHKFTVSIGVSFIDVNDENPLEKAIKMADSALYDVKRLDRNGYAMHENDIAS